MNLFLMMSFHALALVNHLYTIQYSNMAIERSIATEDHLRDVKKFSFRYLTTWNMVMQAIYLLIAFVNDILILNKHKVVPSALEKVEKLRGYFFVSFTFPVSMIVASMFWPVYWYDRELVLPVIVDTILPSWVNYSMHGHILIVVLFEMMQKKVYLPSEMEAFVSLTCFTMAYNMVFFGTYLEEGRWIYGLYYVLSWTQKIGFVVANYLVAVTYQKLGFYLQNAKSDCHLRDYKQTNKKIL